MSKLNIDRTITVVYIVLYVLSIVVFGLSSLPTAILIAVGMAMVVAGVIRDSRQ